MNTMTTNDYDELVMRNFNKGLTRIIEVEPMMFPLLKKFSIDWLDYFKKRTVYYDFFKYFRPSYLKENGKLYILCNMFYDLQMEMLSQLLMNFKFNQDIHEQFQNERLYENVIHIKYNKKSKKYIDLFLEHYDRYIKELYEINFIGEDKDDYSYFADCIDEHDGEHLIIYLDELIQQQQIEIRGACEVYMSNKTLPKDILRYCILPYLK